MAITTTTLSAAVGVNDQFINVASATGITAPNNQTGSGITWLNIDQEYLLVIGVSGTVIQVLRGQSGTGSLAHLSGSIIQIGLPTDFPSQQYNMGTAQIVTALIGGLILDPIRLAGAADAIASTPGNYVIATAGVDAMTCVAPTAAQEGNVIMIHSLTASNVHTLTCSTAALFDGVAVAKTIATWTTGFIGQGLIMKATNLTWNVIAKAGTITLS